MFFLFANVSGCATSGYFIDRRNDAADIFTATTGFGLGAKVRVGVYNLGLPLCFSGELFGLRGGVFNYQVKRDVLGESDPFGEDLWFLILGMEDFSPDKDDPRKKAFNTLPFSPHHTFFEAEACQYTQFDILFGAIIAFRFGFNPGELVDFILGWTSVDIYSDDIERINAQKAKDSIQEEAAKSSR